jgi:hypothetical protein
MILNTTGLNVLNFIRYRESTTDEDYWKDALAYVASTTKNRQLAFFAMDWLSSMCGLWDDSNWANQEMFKGEGKDTIARPGFKIGGQG